MPIDLTYYRLVEPKPGIFVYAFTTQGSKSRGEPAHWLCGVCAANSKHAVLSVYDGVWHCDVCDGYPGLEETYKPELVEAPDRNPYANIPVV